MASSAPTAGLDASDVSVAGVAGGGGAGGGAGVTSAAAAAVPPLQQLVAGLSAATLGSTGVDALVPCGPRESAPPDGDDAPYSYASIKDTSSWLCVDLSKGLTPAQVEARHNHFGSNKMPIPDAQRYPKRYTSDMKALFDEASSQLVRTLRGGSVVEVPQEDLLPGDVTAMGAGDIVPADLRVVAIEPGPTVTNDRAVLTGESYGIKLTTDTQAMTTPALQSRNSAFAGTTIGSGRAAAVVTAIGGTTCMGHIAATLAALDEEAGYLPKGFPEKAAREAERAIMLKARAVPRNLRSLTALSQCSVAIIALPPEAVLGASNVADTVHALASIVTSGYAIYLSAAASAATSHSDFAATIAKQVATEAGVATPVRVQQSGDTLTPQHRPSASSRVFLVSGTGVLPLMQLMQALQRGYGGDDDDAARVVAVAGSATDEATFMRVANVGIAFKVWTKATTCAAADIVLLNPEFESLAKVFELVAPLKDAKESGSSCAVM